jgi:carbon storage regulator
MLVLSRKTGERIMIGDNVIITVARIDQKRVRIGIDAPDDVVIRREEVPLRQPALVSARSR